MFLCFCFEGSHPITASHVRRLGISMSNRIAIVCLSDQRPRLRYPATSSSHLTYPTSKFYPLPLPNHHSTPSPSRSPSAPHPPHGSHRPLQHPTSSSLQVESTARSTSFRSHPSRRTLLPLKLIPPKRSIRYMGILGLSHLWWGAQKGMNWSQRVGMEISISISCQKKSQQNIRSRRNRYPTCPDRRNAEKWRRPKEQAKGR